MKKFLQLLLVLFLSAGSAVAVSWLSEGNAPVAGQTSERSLVKINDILNLGVSSTPVTTNAVALTWYSGQTNVTTSAQVLGTLVSGSFARRATIYSPSTNTGVLSITPTDGLSVRTLTAGQEYLIEVPSGYKFNLTNWKVLSSVSGDAVSVQWCQ